MGVKFHYKEFGSFIIVLNIKTNYSCKCNMTVDGIRSHSEKNNNLIIHVYLQEYPTKFYSNYVLLHLILLFLLQNGQMAAIKGNTIMGMTKQMKSMCLWLNIRLSTKYC